MTGHGRGTADVGGRRATVEVRSVNHRFFDLKVRGGSEPKLEDAISQALRRRAERGSFTVTVRDEGSAGRSVVRVDSDAARAAHLALEELARAIGVAERVPLGLVAAQPGVLQIGEPTPDAEALLATVLPALTVALDELVEMRRAEGATLARDLTARLDRLEAFVADVRGLAEAAPAEWRRRLGERLEKLLAPTGVPVDEARLANELAILADRLDVTEELVRLSSHLTQVRALLGEDGPVGRRLDFLVQEIGREINTIGSKSQSADVARRVVDAKAELEKIREQVQNVE